MCGTLEWKYTKTRLDMPQRNAKSYLVLDYKIFIAGKFLMPNNNLIIISLKNRLTRIKEMFSVHSFYIIFIILNLFHHITLWCKLFIYSQFLNFFIDKIVFKKDTGPRKLLINGRSHTTFWVDSIESFSVCLQTIFIVDLSIYYIA